MWLSKQFSPRGADVGDHRFDVEDDADDDGNSGSKFDFGNEIEALVRVRNSIASAVFQREITDKSGYDDSIMQYPLTVALIKGIEGTKKPVFDAAYAAGQRLRLVFRQALPWLAGVFTTVFGCVKEFDEDSRMHRMVLSVPTSQYNAVCQYGITEGNWDVLKIDPTEVATKPSSSSKNSFVCVPAWVKLSRVYHCQPEMEPVAFNGGTMTVFASSRLAEYSSAVVHSVRQSLRSMARDWWRRRGHGDSLASGSGSRSLNQLVEFKQSRAAYAAALHPDIVRVRRLHSRLLAAGKLHAGCGPGMFCALHGEQIGELLFTNGAPFDPTRKLQHGVQACGRWLNGSFHADDREWLPLLQDGSVDIVVAAAPENSFERTVVLKQHAEAGAAGSPETVVGQALTARDHNFEPVTVARTKASTTTTARRNGKTHHAGGQGHAGQATAGVNAGLVVCLHCRQPRAQCQRDTRGTILVDVRFKRECVDLLFECRWGGPRRGWVPPRMHVRGRTNLELYIHAPDSVLPLAPVDTALLPPREAARQSSTTTTRRRTSTTRQRHRRQPPGGPNNTGRWTKCTRCLVPTQRVVANMRPSLWMAVHAANDDDGDGHGDGTSDNDDDDSGRSDLQWPASATVLAFDEHDGTYVAAVDNVLPEEETSSRGAGGGGGGGGARTGVSRGGSSGVGGASATATHRHLVRLEPTVSYDLQPHQCPPTTLYVVAWLVLPAGLLFT